MSFCTVVNCMDGRVQLPVITYLQDHFGAEFVDSVTEPGPNAILAAGKEMPGVDSIIHRIRISVEKHHSVGIAVVGHHDCAGNPVDDATQIDEVNTAVALLDEEFPGVPTLGIWVDSDWKVNKLS